MNRVYCGFTLIELMVVITLIATVLMLMGAHVAFLDKYVIGSELRKLCTICHYLQQSAVARNQTHTLTFDVAAQQYTFNGHTESLNRAVNFGVVPLAKGPPSNPVTTINSPITFANNRILFTPDGVVHRRSGNICCRPVYVHCFPWPPSATS